MRFSLNTGVSHTMQDHLLMLLLPHFLFPEAERPVNEAMTFERHSHGLGQKPARFSRYCDGKFPLVLVISPGQGK